MALSSKMKRLPLQTADPVGRDLSLSCSCHELERHGPPPKLACSFPSKAGCLEPYLDSTAQCLHTGGAWCGKGETLETGKG